MIIAITLLALLAQQQTPAQVGLAITVAIGQMVQTIERLTQENEQLKKELEKKDAEHKPEASPLHGDDRPR
jgi:hypothetical protein